MDWCEVSIHASREATEAIAGILQEAGAGGVVIEDRRDLEKHRETPFGEMYDLDPGEYPEQGVITKAYLPATHFSEQDQDHIKHAIDNLRTFGLDPGPYTMDISEVAEEDWANAWKANYKPVRVTPSITIVPTWESYDPAPDEHTIQLDPGMAFGTGLHPTTKMCIQAIECRLSPGDRVIDVGCGSGVLSIAAAKLGAGSVLALDLDRVAVSSTIENVSLNEADDTVIVHKNNLLAGIGETADIIVANLLTKIILPFINDVGRALAPGGTFIASGIIKANESKVRDKLSSCGFVLEETYEQGDWTALVATKGR